MINGEEIEKLISTGLEKKLRNLSAKEPHGLYAPIIYTLESGGKRIRPTLLLATAAACGSNPAEFVSQALGLECYHNFTLLHDDVMDRSEMRRGKPTVWCKWNLSTAILSGDAMLTLASEWMDENLDAGTARRVDDAYEKMAMEIFEGQQYDMDFESLRKITIEQYMSMIRLKTSVLLGSACRIGAMLGGASEERIEAMERFGENLGMAFQLRDDWLDVYGDSTEFGKKIGLDILDRKKTWLLVTAMRLKFDELYEILDEDLEDDEMIRQVKRLYDSLNISTLCDNEIARYANEAEKALAEAKLDKEDHEYFSALIARCSSRSK